MGEAATSEIADVLVIGGGSAALCAAIAARVAGDPGYRDVVAIRIITGTHDAVEYLARRAAGHEVTRARCELGRAP